MLPRNTLLLLMCSQAIPCYASITIDPSIDQSEVVVDSVAVGGVTYQIIGVEGYPNYLSGEQAGSPSTPFVDHIFLLPPDMQIDQLEIVSAQWDTMPGKYFLYPAQTGSMEDTTFALPDPEIYSSSDPFPSQPVEVTGQDGMMGFGIVHLSASPIRYIPSDSLLLVLTSLQISLNMGARQFDVIHPERETDWSAARREAAILGVIENPEVSTATQFSPVVANEKSPL